MVFVSVVGFSTFLIFIGIYLSAISISKDKKLRNTIKRIALQYDINLLENIGSAQIHNEIEEKVVKILNDQKNNENSIEETAKIDSKEEKQYINEILDEVNEKNRKNNIPKIIEFTESAGIIHSPWQRLSGLANPYNKSRIGYVKMSAALLQILNRLKCNHYPHKKATIF